MIPDSELTCLDNAPIGAPAVSSPRRARAMEGTTKRRMRAPLALIESCALHDGGCVILYDGLSDPERVCTPRTTAQATSSPFPYSAYPPDAPGVAGAYNDGAAAMPRPRSLRTSFVLATAALGR